MQLFEITLILLTLAVVLVLLSTVAVAWAGVALAGLPMAAAIALGAIVAPPDAAAAAAVLREFNLPRRTVAVLQGESLLNDAVALLVFGLAVSAAVSPGSAWDSLVPRLLIAVPGGAVLGVLCAQLSMRVFNKLARTLSLIIVQFLTTFGTWILAERLQLSPIVAGASAPGGTGTGQTLRTRAARPGAHHTPWAAVGV